MSLADSLGIPPELTPRNRCPIAEIKRTLIQKDVDALVDAMVKIGEGTVHDRKSGKYGYTAVWLARKLNENGHKIGTQAVARHIRGRCGCESL